MQDSNEPLAAAFRAAAGTWRAVSAQRTYQVDCDTALSLFARSAHGNGVSFLLESAEGGEKWARYSVFGCGAVVQAEGHRDAVRITLRGELVRELPPGLDSVRELLNELGPLDGTEATRFSGGFFGYTSYDSVRYFERIPDRHPGGAEQRLFRFVLPEVLFILDNFSQSLRVVAFGCSPESCQVSADEAAAELTARLDGVEGLLQSHEPGELVRCLPFPMESEGKPTALRSNTERRAFMTAVDQAKEYIRAGDIFQVVLSQRFTTERTGDSVLDVYRRLRAQNPSPYMFFFDFGDEALVGASPEVMVRLTGSRAEVRPIAGTAKRGLTEAEDQALERALLADPKERAEHVMLVDLGRNDLGRVSEIGSVEVIEFMIIERYSRVMHIVSDVRGELRQGLDWLDLLAATFPAGTLSGAPKIRAMEIIDELEPDRRGPYGGAVGYIGFDGNMDMCITIRTVHALDGDYHVQVGAGIVADSDPAREFNETVNKARAMLRAIGAEIPEEEVA